MKTHYQVESQSNNDLICYKSRTIGAIEGMFVAVRQLNEQSMIFYVQLCKELNYEGDQDIMDYIQLNKPDLLTT